MTIPSERNKNRENGKPRQAVKFLPVILMIFLGILFITNIIVFGDTSAAIRMHWDLSPSAGDLIVEGKVLVCFITGLLYLIAAAGILRQRYLLASAGVVGAILFLGYYLIELLSWGGTYSPVWTGFFTFGGVNLIVGIYSAMILRSTDIPSHPGIVRGVHQIPGVIGNCYLYEHDGLVLIDTGIPGSDKKILRYIRNNLGKEPADLKTIILTHYHMDHIGSAADLAETTGARIAVHEADAPFIAGFVQSPPLRGIRGIFLGIMMKFFPCRRITPDIILHEGDLISGLRCVHMPGHTPGSIALYDPNLKVLFAGDAITTKRGKIGIPPPSATHDMRQAQESIRRISGLDLGLLMSGHGLVISEDIEGKFREFCKQLNREGEGS